jgi:hypothetical protein
LDRGIKVGFTAFFVGFILPPSSPHLHKHKHADNRCLSVIVMRPRRTKYNLPAATASSMKTSHYRKPLWVPTMQSQPTYEQIHEREQEMTQELAQLPVTTPGSSLLWHARVDQSGRLPPVLGTSSDGTPIFAFLGNGRLTTTKAKREALNFYREFVNTHFGPDRLNPDASPACIFRVCCNREPDFFFEYVSATWDFTVLKRSLTSKLALGIGPPKLQEMYNKHAQNIEALDIQWVEGMPHLPSPKHHQKNHHPNNNRHGAHGGEDPDQDVFDFCETLQKHMKSVGKDAVSRLHQREHRAAIKLQCKWRAKHGQLLAHMKKRLRAEEAEERERLSVAARKIQAAWRRKKGSMASHLLKQAKKEAKLEVQREIKAALKIHVWWSRVSGSYSRKMKERAAAFLKKEEEEMHMMARRIQSAWRMKKGGIAKHCKYFLFEKKGMYVARRCTRD